MIDWVLNGRYAVLETLCWIIDWFIGIDLKNELNFNEAILYFYFDLWLRHTIAS